MLVPFIESNFREIDGWMLKRKQKKKKERKKKKKIRRENEEEEERRSDGMRGGLDTRP